MLFRSGDTFSTSRKFVELKYTHWAIPDYCFAVNGGRFIGTVAGIIFAAEMCVIPGLGNDLLEISLQRRPGVTSSWNDKLVLIPFVPAIVSRVDIKQKTVHITPPFGLLDLTYVKEEKVRIKGFLPPART